MSAYRALARKYRSRHFGELVGQDVLVKTLSNAIENGRLHHAYMFTGIRGTGKTSTARILAKAINYVGPNGDGKPTTGPTDDCPICQAIGEDRHPDVVEIDAASNTGVDDVRQIIDNVRYAPIQARYKVFIIDEVHMLSKAAFNALLKTLEEPPPHVVFIMATTEIRKVPTTILSRCQRFDLRRIDMPTLVEHYRKIAEAENVTIDEEALYLIAQAADGSVRDGLSVFDQAIAQSRGETITADMLRNMLGQANTQYVVELFAQLLRGDVPAVLGQLASLYEAGTDPAAFLDDLLNVTHLVTRIKVTPDVAKDKTLGGAVSELAQQLASEFSLSSLSRVWQMLLKAVPEIAQAPQPQQALEMVMIRIGFAASLPPLEELLKKTTALNNAQNPSPSVAGSAPSSTAPTTPAPTARRFSVVSNGGGAAAQNLQAVAVTMPQPDTEVAAMATPQAERQVETQTERQAEAEKQPDPVAQPVAQPVVDVPDLMTLVTLLEDRGDVLLAADLYANVRVARFAQGKMDIVILPGAAKDLVQDLQKAAFAVSGIRWIISLVNHTDALTLSEMAEAEQKQAIEKAYGDPAVMAIRSALPNAKILSIHTENKQ